MATLLPEWEARRALILRWPWRPDIWPYQARQAQQTLLQLIARIAEPLALRGISIQLETPAQALTEVSALLPAGIEPVVSPYADIWARDCAPFYLASDLPCADLLGLCAKFNGWAGLDPDYPADIEARAQLCQRFAVTCEPLDIVLEGGSLHTNGDGVIVYVASAVLDAARNPGLCREQFESMLRERFGATSVLAIAHGLSCDETGGHVDNLLTFLTPEVVLVAAPDAPDHPDFALGVKLIDTLQRHFAERNKPLQIIRAPLPQLYLSADAAATIKPRPGCKVRPPGMPLCASYTNGIRIDDVYVLPQFGVKEDASVRQLIQRYCPQLQVIAVPSRPLLAGGGGWHCASHGVA